MCETLLARKFLQLIHCIPLLLLSCSPSLGQYRPLEIPKTFTFTQPTPAYADPERQNHLGDFQTGITVKVLKNLPEETLWQVAFPRPQQAAIQAYIQSPKAYEKNPQAFENFKSQLAQFPLLDALLKNPDPWAIPILTLKNDYLKIPPKEGPKGELYELLEKTLLEHSVKFLHLIQADTQHLRYWSWTPPEIYIDYREPDNQKITINLWNKSDSTLKWRHAFKELQTTQDHLSQLEALLGGSPYQHKKNSPRPSHAITALRNNESFYYLANDLMLRLRWSREEFISIDLFSYRGQKRRMHQSFTSETFDQRTRNSVATHPDGHYFIDSIPMISQGDKGYCAAATLARILQYYGYPISMHAIGDLAETTAEDGTHYDEIFNSIRRICNSTPFKITVIRNTKREQLLAYIQRGIPLYWIIPGHARLINGIHPEGGILYSDSYGLGHEFKKMTWSEFIELNRTLFAIELR